ncbi:MAG: DUF3786 domain-containing protein [Candidatus Omnitrophica bacterium]|nr:DUF3786 domain-containing protein [Candidatus Omnitrophota bacterium]
MIMGYEVAINKAWEEVFLYNIGKETAVKFLGDEYTLDPENKKVISLACNITAKDFYSILILHYLVQMAKGLPLLTGEWVSFKEMAGVEGYASAFRKRAIEPIIRKYGAHPEGILSVLDRLTGKKINQGDIGIVLEVFKGVPVLVTLWKADDEFGPEANMLFDRNIAKIFCIEDVVVLAGLVASSL